MCPTQSTSLLYPAGHCCRARRQTTTKLFSLPLRLCYISLPDWPQKAQYLSTKWDSIRNLHSTRQPRLSSALGQAYAHLAYLHVIQYMNTVGISHYALPPTIRPRSSFASGTRVIVPSPSLILMFTYTTAKLWSYDRLCVVQPRSLENCSGSRANQPQARSPPPPSLQTCATSFPSRE
jgi:hypothetical protein